MDKGHAIPYEAPYDTPGGFNNNKSVGIIPMDYPQYVNNSDRPFLPEGDAMVSDVMDTTPSNCSNDYCVSDELYLDMIQDFVFPTWFEWILIVLYFYVFLMGLVGNFFVCFAVLRNRHMRTVTNYFIVNLAGADFMVILICMPPTVLEDVTETWYMGKEMCKSVKYLQGVSVSVSVLTLTAISVERFFAICNPLQFRSTTKRARVTIIIIWVASLFLMLPEIFALEVYPKFPSDFTLLLTSCRSSWRNNYMHFQLLFLAVQVGFLYLFPFILMGFCYIRIATVLWSNNLPYERSHKPLNASNGKSQVESQIIARRKVAKMLIAVVLMFGVCYLPVHVINILRYAGAMSAMGEGAIYFALIAHWLCYFNSAINPVIYNFMSAKFRHEFSLSCTCRRKRKRHGDRTYSNRYNDNTQTEQVTMTTLAPVGPPCSDSSWE